MTTYQPFRHPLEHKVSFGKDLSKLLKKNSNTKSRVKPNLTLDMMKEE
jgi:hypothetical protein